MVEMSSFSDTSSYLTFLVKIPDLVAEAIENGKHASKNEISAISTTQSLTIDC